MMSPKDKRNCCGSVSQDRLSSLPGDVIDDILLRLPLRDIVRTSILSKKWRYNWCRLPELTLDHTLLNTTTISGDPSVILGKVIDSILSLHARPITKLTLLIPSPGRCPKIDNLIYFLSENGIQHLVLRGLFKKNPYMLPSSFFSCLQLRHLTLQKCLISPPPTFKGFERLISLELHDAKVCYKFLGSFISNCPLLEYLVLKISDILRDVIEINAPKLKCFDFKGMLGSICLKNVPFLSKVSLRHSRIYVLEGNYDIAKYFESSTAIETLHLDCFSLEFFTAGVGELPAARPPFIVDGVKHLCLSKIYMCCLKDVSRALCLIGSFPYLQNMEIKVVDHDYDITALERLEVESFPDVSFSRLREVKLKGHLLTKHGILLIKLVLAKSPVLVKMLLKPYSYEESEAVEILRERLPEFQYASPEVEVNMIPKGTVIFRQMLVK